MPRGFSERTLRRAHAGTGTGTGTGTDIALHASSATCLQPLLKVRYATQVGAPNKATVTNTLPQPLPRSRPRSRPWSRSYSWFVPGCCQDVRPGPAPVARYRPP